MKHHCAPPEWKPRICPWCGEFPLIRRAEGPYILWSCPAIECFVTDEDELYSESPDQYLARLGREAMNDE